MSPGFVIEKPILELLDIDRDTELDMRTDGDRLIISPVRKGKKERVRAAHQRALIAHDETLRRLAR
jgi:antitoxin component of MazEF toxin-antitoxin module